MEESFGISTCYVPTASSTPLIRLTRQLLAKSVISCSTNTHSNWPIQKVDVSVIEVSDSEDADTSDDSGRLVIDLESELREVERVLELDSELDRQSNASTAETITVPNGSKNIKPKIILERMNPNYVRDMINGVQLTESQAPKMVSSPKKSARNAITQTDRPKASSSNADVEIDYDTSEWQPILKLNRIAENVDNNQGRKATRGTAAKPKGIDPKSWQWQPNVELDRINANEADDQDESEDTDVPPIEFDDDDTSFIRELSPDRAAKQFQKRLEVIKQTMQPMPTRLSETNRKRKRPQRPVNKSRLEYEATLKRLQEKPKKRRKNAKRSLGRKLYNPNDSFEELTEKENEQLIAIEPTPKRRRTVSLQPTRILPNRSAKNVTLKGKTQAK